MNIESAGSLHELAKEFSEFRGEVHSRIASLETQQASQNVTLHNLQARLDSIFSVLVAGLFAIVAGLVILYFQLLSVQRQPQPVSSPAKAERSFNAGGPNDARDR